jgi:hypothetical protein
MNQSNSTRRAAASPPLAKSEVEITLGVAVCVFTGTGQQLVDEGVLTPANLRLMQQAPGHLGVVRFDSGDDFVVLVQRTTAGGDEYVARRLHHPEEDGVFEKLLIGMFDRNRRWERGFVPVAAAAYVERRSSKDKAFQAFKKQLLAA